MGEQLEQYLELMRFVGQTLPVVFELIVFDTTRDELPILLRINRQNGTQTMSKNLVSGILRSERLREVGSVAGCLRQNDMGKMVKSSVYLIKDEGGEPIAAVCVNALCDIFLQMQTLVSGVLQFSAADISDLERQADAGHEDYAEPTLDMITKMVGDYAVDAERISQNERIEIICDLYDMGVFELKGAVAKTAEELKISEQSVYRYLSKIKKARL